MPRIHCPACGQAGAQYLGVDDGGGAYGTSVCDTFRCPYCDYEWDENCIDTRADFEEDDALELIDDDDDDNDDDSGGVYVTSDIPF